MHRAFGLLIVVLVLAASACAGSRPTLDESAGVPREVPVDDTDTSAEAADPVVMRLGVGVTWSGDPADAGPASIVTRVLADLLHEGLARLDDDGRPVPALAERWSVTDDRLTWTFVLPEDLRDGAGEPLTARDVMRSLDHVAARGASDLAAVALTAITGWSDRMNGDTGGVAGFAAPDDHTFIVSLDRPFELLPHVLAAPAFGIVGRDADDAIRTTGSFRYGDADDVLVAVDSESAVDRIELIDASGDVGADLLSEGAVDWAVLSAGRGADDIPGSVIRQPLDIRVGVAVRLADADDRHGLLAAIDPLALTSGIVAFAPVPSPIVNPDAAPPIAVSVEIPVGRLQPVATALADQLEAAGVLVTRVESDAVQYAEHVASGQALVFPVVLPGGLHGDVSALQAFAPGSTDDVFGVRSEERSALAAAIEAEQDPDQRALFVDALEEAVLDDGLLRIVGQLEVRLGVGPALTGLTHNADGTLVLDRVEPAAPELDSAAG